MPTPCRCSVGRGSIGPAGQLQRCIVFLTVVNFREGYGGYRTLPRSVSRHNFRCAVIVLQGQLHGKGRAVAVVVAGAGQPHDTFVPARAQHGARAVRAGVQQRRDIVGLVEQATIIACPAGGHLISADFRTIEVKIVKPQRRCTGIGCPYSRAYRKITPHHRAGRGFPAGVGILRTDECRTPLPLWVQQRCDKAARRAPIAGLETCGGVGLDLHAGVIPR